MIGGSTVNNPFWKMSVACNSHENGSFTGQSGSFNFERDDEELTLEGPDVEFIWAESPGPIVPSHLLIGGEIFECNRIREWVGNWCWDSCDIANNDFLRILVFLAARGYTPTIGSTELFSFYELIQERASVVVN